MSNDSSTGDTGDNLHGGDEGHASDIPEESPTTESELAMSAQAARINGDDDDDQNKK